MSIIFYKIFSKSPCFRPPSIKVWFKYVFHSKGSLSIFYFPLGNQRSIFFNHIFSCINSTCSCHFNKLFLKFYVIEKFTSYALLICENEVCFFFLSRILFLFSVRFVHLSSFLIFKVLLRKSISTVFILSVIWFFICYVSPP